MPWCNNVVFLRRFEFEFSLCLSLSFYLDMETKELKTKYGNTPNKVLVYFYIKNYKKGLKKLRLQRGI